MKSVIVEDSPCFTAPTLLRGTLTPSFMGTPWLWLSVLGRRECVALLKFVGAGDWERGEEGTAEFGGPFAQADCTGSGGGILDAVAVEDLLILRNKKKSWLLAIVVWIV